MPAPPEYQPLPHDGGDPEDSEHYPPQQPRPAMYYGEGEFDPPSSDDEEDSAFIEKQKGGEGERDGAALEEDGELIVGGKVRCRNHVRGGCKSKLLRVCVCIVEPQTALVAAMPGVQPARAGDYGRPDWYIRGVLV